LKQIAAGHEGRHQRRELTELVEDGGRRDATRSALDHIEGPLAERIHAVAGTRPVRAIVTLRTRRRRQAIERDGRVVGELALDDERAGRRHDRPSPFHRIEVGWHPPSRRRVWSRSSRRCSRAARCRCRSARSSKKRCTCAVCDRSRRPRLACIDGTMPAGDVALASLRRSFTELLEHEPGTLGDDPEALHRMRVATATASDARVFTPALPARAAALRAPLGWLAAVLGDVRDVDVQLERIAGWRKEMDARDAHALDAVAAVLRRRRIVGRQRMLRALDSGRYERLVARFSALLRGHAPRRGAAREPIVAVAPAWIRKRMRRSARRETRRAESPATEYHALRIRCKKLRYALEAHADVYGSHRAVCSTRSCGCRAPRRSPGRGGRLHRSAGACDRRGIGLSRDAIFVIGKIAARHEREGQRRALRTLQRGNRTPLEASPPGHGQRVSLDGDAALRDRAATPAVRRRPLTAVPPRSCGVRVAERVQPLRRRTGRRATPVVAG
jgi:CHAD domain-containing protein